MLHLWFPYGHLLLSYLTICTLPFHISFTTLTMGKEQHIRVCNPLLQVDCEGPTLISYIVAKHLAMLLVAQSHTTVRAVRHTAVPILDTIRDNYPSA